MRHLSGNNKLWNNNINLWNKKQELFQRIGIKQHGVMVVYIHFLYYIITS